MLEIKGIQLSPRLKKVADWLPQLGRFADIGSDHAYLPIYMVLKYPQVTAIVGEVVQGPFRAATQSVGRFGVSDRVECRLGNGLQVLQPHEVQCVSICGMGGGTIVEILNQSPEIVGNLKEMILQPNTHAQVVRKWAEENGYFIFQEDLIEDAGLLYEVLFLQKGVSPKMSPLDLRFGPLNQANRHPLLPILLNEELKRIERVLIQLGEAGRSEEVINKIAEYQKWKLEVEELLKKW